MFSRKLKDLNGLISKFNKPYLVDKIANRIIKFVSNGSKVFFAGNGGSSSQADHLAAELIGRFKKDRMPIPAISLGTNKAIITAIGNDYGYDDVFNREFNSLYRDGDVLIVISTSGDSKNLISLAKECYGKSVYCVGLLGCGGGKLKSLCDDCIIIDSLETDLIQEMHLTIGHYICQKIEDLK